MRQAPGSKGPWEGDAIRRKVYRGEVASEPLRIWLADLMSSLQCLMEIFIKFHLEEAEEGNR